MDTRLQTAASEIESTGTALHIPANSDDATSLEPFNPKLPPRLRRRLLECKSTHISAQDIEAKLRDANLRRQQFYESLSCKARRTRPAAYAPSQEEHLGQQLASKLDAAEKKRSSLLAEIQNRLVKMDELRQAAKTGAEMRYVTERNELSIKLESRVQQAEANRMLLLNARRERSAAEKEKSSQLLMRRIIQEHKYKECVRAAIQRKRTSAERKRLGLLEAEKSRARARALQVQQVASSISSQRELHRLKLKEQLEKRLQRAKWLREEYLRKRGSLSNSGCTSPKTVGYKMLLATKLARCWRHYVRVKGTSFTLAKAYSALEINQESVKLMSFEKLSLHIESGVTIQMVKALLDRLESRINIRQEIVGAKGHLHLENIDHLLRRVANPVKRVDITSASSKEVAPTLKTLSRYPVRIFLCAYMILGHPDAVFSWKGENETALFKAAEALIQGFELLIKVMLEGPVWSQQGKLSFSTFGKLTFSSQLETFDKMWCSYLYCFVIWKVKDAKLLEEDLVRVACQLEISRMQTKRTIGRDSTHPMPILEAFQDQVTKNQKLLRSKVQQLSGSAGLEHMECALYEARARFLEVKEAGSLLGSSSNRCSSPCSSVQSESNISCGSGGNSSAAEDYHKGGHNVCSMVKDFDSSSGSEVASSSPEAFADHHLSGGLTLVTDNEVIVNEIVHGTHGDMVDGLLNNNGKQGSNKARVRDTTEKAFWDSVMESLKQDCPDYSWVLKLIKEVRDELCQMSPSSWREEIDQTIDIDIISEILKSGILDMEYLGRILEFALVTLQKLSAPAREDEVKTTHQKLLRELAEISQAQGPSNSSCALLLVRGLRFVLEQIQELKRDMSKARISMLEPLVKGPAGQEYLRSAFCKRYGPPAGATQSLPLVNQWLSMVIPVSQQDWDENVDSLSALISTDVRYSLGVSPTPLRAGGTILRTSSLAAPISNLEGTEQPECKGERLDLLLRLGLLKLVLEIEGLTIERLPETLKLNVIRLRSVQAQMQKILVISASILVLRQILVSERLVNNQIDTENVISDCVEQLCDLLDNNEDVGISEIVERLISFAVCDNDLAKCQSRKEVMANMLGKSLRAGDTVFVRVSHAVHSAARGIVLGGSGAKGRQLAEAALKHVGASLLTRKLVDAVQGLVIMANVSASVHGAWYEEVLRNLS